MQYSLPNGGKNDNKKHMQNEGADFKYVTYNTVQHIRLDFIHV